MLWSDLHFQEVRRFHLPEEMADQRRVAGPTPSAGPDLRLLRSLLPTPALLFFLIKLLASGQQPHLPSSPGE